MLRPKGLAANKPPGQYTYPGNDAKVVAHLRVAHVNLAGAPAPDTSPPLAPDAPGGPCFSELAPPVALRPAARTDRGVSNISLRLCG
jgi:hypothetical protein